jgi:hypothetical protein
MVPSTLARKLCISVSEINAGIKHLISPGLLIIAPPILTGSYDLSLNARPQSQQQIDKLYQPISKACEECLISGVKYMFLAKLGKITRGIVTSYAAPIF